MRSLVLALLLLMTFAAYADEAKDVDHPFFDHEKHKKVNEELQQKCAFCHPFKAVPETSKIEVKDLFDKLLIKPEKDICHSCHQAKDPLRTKLFACQTCHSETSKVVPPDHRSNWLSKHGRAASTPLLCQECHEETECVFCHKRFETIRPHAHPRNFRFFHSLEARLNPASCGSCHVVSQCEDCHKNGGVLK